MADVSFRVTSDTQPLKRSLDDADRAVKKSIDKINRDFNRIKTGTDAADKSMRQFRGSLGRLGGVSQQVQDIAVQFQAGTNAAVIFAQQGPQIASAFGPLGAILGGVGAVAVVAGQQLFNMGTNAAKAAETLGTTLDSALDDSTNAAKRYADQIRKADQAQRDFASSLAGLQTVELTAEAGDLLGGLNLDAQINADPVIKRLRISGSGPGPNVLSESARLRRDVTGPIRAAINAGRPNEVLRLAKEAGLFTAANSEAVQRLVEIAQRVQLNRLIENTDTAGLDRLAGEPPPIPQQRPLPTPQARPSRGNGADAEIAKLKSLDEARDELLKKVKQERADTAALAAARRQGADAVEQLNDQLEIRNALASVGLTIDSETGAAIAAEIQARQDLEDTIAAEADARAALDKAITEPIKDTLPEAAIAVQQSLTAHADVPAEVRDEIAAKLRELSA